MAKVSSEVVEEEEADMQVAKSPFQVSTAQLPILSIFSHRPLFFPALHRGYKNKRLEGRRTSIVRGGTSRGNELKLIWKREEVRGGSRP